MLFVSICVIFPFKSYRVELVRRITGQLLIAMPAIVFFNNRYHCVLLLPCVYILFISYLVFVFFVLLITYLLINCCMFFRFGTQVMEAYLVSGDRRIPETVFLPWRAVLLERRYHIEH